MCLFFSSSSFNIEITVDSFSALIYTLVSSANKIDKRTSETLDKSLIYNMKRSGPRILLCGTPQLCDSFSIRFRCVNLDKLFAICQIAFESPERITSYAIFILILRLRYFDLPYQMLFSDQENTQSQHFHV